MLTDLYSRFGHIESLESLGDFLIPNRSPMFEVDVSVAIADNPKKLDSLILNYSLDFSAKLDQVIFGVSNSASMTEALLAGFSELTEVTTLATGQCLAEETNHLLNGGLKIFRQSTTSNGTTRRRRLKVRKLSEKELLNYASIEEGPLKESLDCFTALIADVPDRVANSQNRIRIELTRTIDSSIDAVPWIVERPLFLHRFTLDVRGCSRVPMTCQLYPFMATNETAHLLPLDSGPVAMLNPYGWLYVGQGMMMTWRPASKNASVLGVN